MKLLAERYDYEWFNPATARIASTGSMAAAGGNESFTPPFAGPAVLYLKAAGAKAASKD